MEVASSGAAYDSALSIREMAPGAAARMADALGLVVAGLPGFTLFSAKDGWLLLLCCWQAGLALAAAGLSGRGHRHRCPSSVVWWWGWVVTTLLVGEVRVASAVSMSSSTATCRRARAFGWQGTGTR